MSFTARMEEELDEIEEGKLPWQRVGEGILRALRGGSGAGQRRDGVLQGRHPHGQEVRKMRPGRIARAHQPAGIFPGLLALSGMRFHRRPFAGAPAGNGDAETPTCDNCGKRNGDQARALGRVPGVLGLSGLQDDAAAGCRHARGAAAGRSARTKIAPIAARNWC